MLPENALDVEFELRCAQHAAHYLAPSKRAWSGYLDRVIQFDATDSAPQQPWLWKALPLSRGWYLAVHRLRWTANKVSTRQEFEAEIAPVVARFLDKGGNYTFFLAGIFMEMIDNNAVEEDLQQRALQGDADQVGLIQLLQWQTPAARLACHPLVQRVLESLLRIAAGKRVI